MVTKHQSINQKNKLFNSPTAERFCRKKMEVTANWRFISNDNKYNESNSDNNIMISYLNLPTAERLFKV